METNTPVKIREMAMVVRKMSFAEAEDEDVTYYALQGWKKSASIAEGMRRTIWKDEYASIMQRNVRVRKLKEDRDDFE